MRVDLHAECEGDMMNAVGVLGELSKQKFRGNVVDLCFVRLDRRFNVLRARFGD